MPVAIRSLNGYYGFLDSLRSLEMTTVTEQFSILNSQFLILNSPFSILNYTLRSIYKSGIL